MTVMTRGMMKIRIAGCSKNLRGKAPRESTSEDVLTSYVGSEEIERNAAYEVFSAACAR
jgi:hypothetical protein